MASRTRKILTGLGVTLVALVVLVVGACALFSKSRPEGQPGPKAEELTQKMQAAVGTEDWAREVGAISWVFAGRNRHLWDKRRDFARVELEGGEVALVDLRDQTGVARVGGQPVEGERADEIVAQGWAAWVNDAFWLNPIAKATDPGTKREVVTLEDGRSALLVRYGSGGLTPGDEYLWILEEDGTPEAVRMWVSNIPVKGAEFSWEDWKDLPGDARVASHHEGLVTIDLTEIEAAHTLDELVEGEDPFAPLMARRGGAKTPKEAPAEDAPAEDAPAPSSQPASAPD